MYFVAKIFGGAKVVFGRWKYVEHPVFNNCLTDFIDFNTL